VSLLSVNSSEYSLVDHNKNTITAININAPRSNFLGELIKVIVYLKKKGKEYMKTTTTTDKSSFVFPLSLSKIKK
jgi:hypothetical protein